VSVFEAGTVNYREIATLKSVSWSLKLNDTIRKIAAFQSTLNSSIVSYFIYRAYAYRAYNPRFCVSRLLPISQSAITFDVLKVTPQTTVFSMS